MAAQPPRRPPPPGGSRRSPPPPSGVGGSAPRPPPGPPTAPAPAPASRRGVPRVPAAFDENHLPSILHRPNPMTIEAERSARRRTCRFLEEAGGQRCLRLPRVAVATALVLFHRFYAKHAFQEHDRFEVSLACLLLAGKTEESPKKLDHVIRECWRLRRKGELNAQKAGAGGDSPSLSGGSPTAMQSPSSDSMNIDPKSEEYARLKERVLLLERVILHTIGFELSIDHPYKFLVECAQNLNVKRALEYSSSPPTKGGSASGSAGSSGARGAAAAQSTQIVPVLVQYAMNFANDSMHTMLCLQYDAKEIALACVYLSGRWSNIRPTGGRSWLELLDGIVVEDLTYISVQILDLVAAKKGGAVKKAINAIRQDLDDMVRNRSDGPEAKRQKH